MSTVVSVLDEDSRQSRTDNIAVVDPAKRRILWIPRDLWCKSLDNRINRAFGKGGHGLLLSCLREHGITAESSICFRRSATVRAAADLRVSVPVGEVMNFWYPLQPTKPIKEGRKHITFNPPVELLAGERIHQWLGARKSFDKGSSDLNRIERHKTFIRCLLAEGFDFKKLIPDPEYFSIYGSCAYEDLAQVRPDWGFETFGPVVDRKIREMQVVVKIGRLDPRYILRSIRLYLHKFVIRHGNQAKGRYRPKT